MLPIYDPASLTESIDLCKEAMSIGQLLDNQTLDSFQEEVRSSNLPDRVKNLITREFYCGCDIRSKVSYMMNYHHDNVRIVGYMFDWALRNKKWRQHH